jgi:hypothetical protein
VAVKQCGGSKANSLSSRAMSEASLAKFKTGWGSDDAIKTLYRLRWARPAMTVPSSGRDGPLLRMMVVLRNCIVLKDGSFGGAVNEGPSRTSKT